MQERREASSSPASKYSLEQVDDIVKELKDAQIVFNAPAKMMYGEPQQVELLLSAKLSIPELEAKILEKLNVGSAVVKISNRMEAKLTGSSGLAVREHSSALQAISSDQVTSWLWEVMPNEEGKRMLHLQLFAHIEVNGRETVKVFGTFDRKIEVEITIPQKVVRFGGGNWQWLVTAILLPLVGVVWKKWQEKRTGENREKPAPKPEPRSTEFLQSRRARASRSAPYLPSRRRSG